MKRTIPIVLSGIILLSTLAGCTNPSTQTKIDTKQTVKVGVIAPLSGPAANYGEDAVNVYRFITEKFNKENTGIQIELVIEDGKCDGKNATSAVQKLIMVDKVQAIVGGFCSAETIAAGKIAQANKVFMLSPASSAPEITNIGNYIFRYWNDAYVTKKLAEYMNNQKIKNLAIIAENTDYSLGYSSSLKKLFAGNIILEEKYNADEKDFSIIAKKIKKQINNIDGIIFITSSDSNTMDIVKSFNDQGILEALKGKIFGTELTATDSVKQGLGNLLENIKLAQLVGIDELGDQAKQFTEDLSKLFEIKSSHLFAVLEAETMQVVLDAIKAKGNNGEAIREYVANHSNSNPIKGIIGNYYFTDTRDASSLQFKIYQFQKGELKVIE